MRKLTPQAVHAVIATLEAIIEDPMVLTEVDGDTRVALLKAAGRVSRPTRDETRRASRALRAHRREQDRDHDRGVRAATHIRMARESPVFTAPARLVTSTEAPSTTDDGGEELRTPRSCYVCKAEFRKVHFFYDSMCGP